MQWLGHVTKVDEASVTLGSLGFRSRPGIPRMNWRDVAKKDLQ